MKIAIIHYWWISNRGGESVVADLVKIFPNADLFFHVYDEKLVKETLGSKFTGKIRTSFISKLPKAKKYYQKYLLFMPIALEQLDLSGYDLVISTESGPSKGVITDPEAVYICYCFTPMRYIWDMYHQYIKNSSWITKVIFIPVSHYLRIWDRVSSDRVDYFLSDSDFVKKRINKFYNKDATTLYPAVDISRFTHEKERKKFYLYLGQLTPYKKIDLAVEAFNKLGLPLIVIGEGELLPKMKQLAKKNIIFLGRQPFEVVKEHLETCRALVFPGIEDFGIVPVEAMAAGAPVIAYAKGGAMETVVDGKTGIHFHEHSIDALKASILRIELGKINFDSSEIRQHAEKFDTKIFKKNFLLFLESKGVDLKYLNETSN